MSGFDACESRGGVVSVCGRPLLQALSLHGKRHLHWIQVMELTCCW